MAKREEEDVDIDAPEVVAGMSNNKMMKECGINAEEDKLKVERKYFSYCYDGLKGHRHRECPRVVMHFDEKSGDASVFSIEDRHVHKFDVTSRTWSLVKTRVLAPCGYSHSVCSYNGKIYMFGGMNEVSCFDIATSSWVNCETGGQVPDVFGHSCTMIGSIMFIHGGLTREWPWEYTNDLYGLDLETLMWRLYPCTGTHVEGRWFHTATAVRNHKIIVFGGCYHRHCYDKNFYCYDLRDGKWSQMITTGYEPIGRHGHIAAYCRESIIYHGGYSSGGPIRRDMGDMIVLNTITNHITRVRPWGEHPCGIWASCVLVGSELIICGGSKGRYDCSETFVLNLFPSLQEMCVSFILNNGMDYSLLPPHLCLYLMKLSSLDKKRNETI